MTDAIPRLNAALEGRYRIERELGEGGMATVYLADDLKHERKVALKVLKPELAAVVGAERFLAEIKTTANLQHPHILPLHDSGEADGLLFYVMPYVKGESLRERLEREHQLPVDDAVRIATNMAEALDYAHRHGVIHRDIKPANVLLADGKPVIADFGIALAVGAAGGGRLTETGLSLGTPHYMSPEQATGDQKVGPATDIYALGCVLFEMLVGEPPFTGSTAQAVLGAIITGEIPSAQAKRSTVPANVDAVIARALEKVPADRFKSSTEAVSALADPSFTHRAPAGPLAGGRAGLATSGWAIAAVAVVVAVWSVWSRGAGGPAMGVERLSVRLPEPMADAGQFALSSDGSFIVYQGPSVDGEGTQLWMRRWELLNATPVPNTRDAAYPAISPSQDRVAFHRDGGLVFVVDLATGAERQVAEGFFSPSWSPDEEWLYFELPSGMAEGRPDAPLIGRVAVSGGEVEPVLRADEPFTVWDTQVLPRGRAVVYANMSADRLEVVELSSGERKELGPGWFPRFSNGQLLYVLDESLFAAPFDPDRLEFTGPPRLLSERMGPARNAALPFAVSQEGTLVFSPYPEDEMVWIDRAGRVTPVESGWTFDSGEGSAAWSISPDGTRVAFRARTEDGRDVWLKSLVEDGPARRLTLDPSRDDWPLWIDNETVAFRSSRGDAGSGVWTRRTDGSGPAELLTGSSGSVFFRFATAPDGVVIERNDETDDLLLWRRGDDTESLMAVSTPEFDEAAPTVSPDGEWLAYESNRSGRYEVWVAPFPDGTPAEARRVSEEGGIRPKWGRDGRSLYFVQNRGVGTGVLASAQVMAASMDARAGLSIGTPEVVVALPSGVMVNPRRNFYDVSLDGDRFLVARKAYEGGSPELIRIRTFLGLLEGG